MIGAAMGYLYGILRMEEQLRQARDERMAAEARREEASRLERTAHRADRGQVGWSSRTLVPGTTVGR